MPGRGIVWVICLAIAAWLCGPAVQALAQDEKPAEPKKEEPAPTPGESPQDAPATTGENGPPKAPSDLKMEDKDKVRTAIDKAITYLKAQQSSSGEFVGYYHSGVAASGAPGLHSGGYPAGETAIALLAMRFAGVPVNDASFQKGLKYLLEHPSKKTYCNSLVAQLLASLPKEKKTEEVTKRLQELADELGDAQISNGTWTYYGVTEAQQKSNHLLCGDNSNTQFAVLGLWKLADAGAKVKEKVWQACEQHFLKTQGTSGGWGYWSPLAMAVGPNETKLGSASTPTMTMTGLASLYIFLDQLHLQDEGKYNGSAAPRCGANKVFEQRIDKALERAQADMAAWFSEKRMTRRTAQRRGQQDVRVFNLIDLYYMYSIERVGDASGRKTFGSIDWYGEVGELLLEEQNEDGSWCGPPPTDNKPVLTPEKPKGNPKLVAETAMAVLFLAKGRAPVFFNKLSYPGDWENDRRDVANLARFATDTLEMSFNWQVVDIKSDPMEWLDSPVLFFNGHNGPVKLTKEEKDKLKSYVRNNGLIFAEACCGRGNFTSTVRALGKELWPDLDWQKLPDDHPLYTQKTVYDIEKKPALVALVDKKGFAFFILSPTDLSCAWHQELSIEYRDYFRLAVNVYKYAKRDEPIRPRTTR